MHVLERKSQCVSMCASGIQRERRYPWATIVPVTYEQVTTTFAMQHLNRLECQLTKISINTFK